MSHHPSVPKIAFVGVGWIGRLRLAALAKNPNVSIVAVADPSPEARGAAVAMLPDAREYTDHRALLDGENLDGVVIASPNVFHAEQALDALDRGAAVFCEKPLTRTSAETVRIVKRSRELGLPLGVDYCYRHLEAVRMMKHLLDGGDIGAPRLIDLVFHNAYGPDKPWFYRRDFSGGGCLMDLGSHLVDLALHLLPHRTVRRMTSRLYAGERPLEPRSSDVEDLALVEAQMNGACVRIACSWKQSVGANCEIRFQIYGTDGGISVHNVEGSFFDFQGELWKGAKRETFASPPDDWGGRALEGWLGRLAPSGRTGDLTRDELERMEGERLIQGAEILEAAYGETKPSVVGLDGKPHDSGPAPDPSSETPRLPESVGRK